MGRKIEGGFSLLTVRNFFLSRAAHFRLTSVMTISIHVCNGRHSCFFAFRTHHGAVPKWLRVRSANPLFSGSSPLGASCSSPKSIVSRPGRAAFGFGLFFAQVVELVDTRDLKSLGSRSVPVQVRPWAHTRRRTGIRLFSDTYSYRGSTAGSPGVSSPAVLPAAI